MFDFEKYGFKKKEKNRIWNKDDYIIYNGLGENEDGWFTIELFTLCKNEDVGDSDKIIFRGTPEEMDIYLKGKYRDETLNILLDGEITKK